MKKLILAMFVIIVYGFGRENPFDGATQIPSEKKQSSKKYENSTIKPKSKISQVKQNYYKPLKNITIIEENSNIKIITSREIINTFTMIEENKIAMDFKIRNDESFLSRNVSFGNNKYFSSINLGSHANEGFFRITIQTKDNPKKYTVKQFDKFISIKKL